MITPIDVNPQQLLQDLDDVRGPELSDVPCRNSLDVPCFTCQEMNHGGRYTHPNPLYN